MLEFAAPSLNLLPRVHHPLPTGCSGCSEGPGQAGAAADTGQAERVERGGGEGGG